MMQFIIRILKFIPDFFLFFSWAYQSNCNHTGRRGWECIPSIGEIAFIAWTPDTGVQIYRQIKEEDETFLDPVGLGPTVDNPYYHLVAVGDRLYPLPWFKRLYQERREQWEFKPEVSQ